MDADFKIEAHPPELIDRIVRRLTPPLAREAIVGDLWERYRSPARYLFEALQTLPFVIVSQVRRSVRLSLIGLQAFILFAALGGFETSVRVVSHWPQAVVPTLAALMATILRDAYRRKDQRTLHRAMFDTVAAAVCVAASQALLIALTAAGALAPGWVLPPPFAALGIIMQPILFVLRTGTSLEENAARSYESAVSMQELAQDYEQFQRQVDWRNRAEVAAIVTIIAGSSWFLLRFNPLMAPIGWATQFIFALLAVYLSMRGSALPTRSDTGFDSLRARYQTELLRQCRLRRMMWWFWLAPLFLGLIIKWLVRGTLQGQPLRVMLGIAMVGMLVACLAHLNRDRARQAQNRIGHLAALRERYAS